MLSELSVSNLGTIKEAHLEFSEGLVAITGESGAGKSMLLGGLKLLLGGRADHGLIRENCGKATVDGLWNLKSESFIEELENRGCLVDDGEFWISRILGEKNRFTLGGRPSPTSSVSDFKDKLVEIHGQSDQHKLRDLAHQRNILDSFAGEAFQKALIEYKTSFKEWKNLKKTIKNIEENYSRLELEKRFNEDLVNRFQALDPQENELEETQTEIQKLSHLEEIFENLQLVGGIMFPEDGAGPFEPFELALRQLRKIAQHDSELSLIVEKIEDSMSPLEESLGDLETYVSSVDLQELSHLEALEERLFELKSFAKPYGGDLDKAISAALEAEEKLESDESSLNIEEIREKLEAAEIVLRKNASVLTKLRKEAGEKLSLGVNAELAELAMGGITFLVEISEIDFQSSGKDEVSFMIESKGNTRRSIVKAASGGELSRLMLALEVVTVNDDEAMTFVFDEIDTGVGGSTAMEIGKRLARLAKKHQVIVVTHLPQVAAWADSQLVITKDISGEINSEVKNVLEDDRVSEIARMLSGLNDSETGLAHAKELLATASEIKASF